MRVTARWARPRARVFFLWEAVGVISRRHQELALRRRYGGAEVEDAVDVISLFVWRHGKMLGEISASWKQLKRVEAFCA